jgi:hypothetical protein
MTIYNGMPAGDLGGEGWECPWSGPSGGQCLEAKRLDDGRVAVRQSTDPEGPALIFTRGEFQAFISGARNGLADHLVS